MDLLAGKLVAMVCLFFLVLICGGLPIWLFSCFRSAKVNHSATGKYCTGRSSLDVKQLLCALNSFAGGVFLGTCMLDLLPEAREAILENIDAWPNFLQDYPLTELAVIFGVVLLLIVELVIGECTGKILDNSEESKLADHVTCRQGCDTGDELQGDLISTSSLDVEDFTTESPLMEPVFETETPSTIRISFRIIALIIALSFHSLFDGLAIGLQTSLTSFASVFFAISMHKTVFAFSLGIRLAEAGEKLVTHVYVYVLCFAVASPLGIAIGLLVEYLATGLPGGPIISGLLQSLATGTLMYVTFFEILPEEFRSRFSFVRTLSLVVGIGLIAFLVASVSE